MGSRDLANRISAAPSIAASTRTATVNGVGVDTLGYDSAAVLVDLGVFAGTGPTATIDIQESDDNATFTSVAAADLVDGQLPGITATNDEQLYERGYRGSKRYLRVAITAIAGTGPSLPISAIVVRGHASKTPV